MTTPLFADVYQGHDSPRYRVFVFKGETFLETPHGTIAIAEGREVRLRISALDASQEFKVEAEGDW